MQTLIIFEEVPKHTRLYLLPDAPDWVVAADGLFVNLNCPKEGPGRDALFRINDAIEEERSNCLKPEDDFAAQWAKHKVSSPLRILGDVVVVRCGWLL